MNKEKFEILKAKQEEIKKLKKEMVEASNKIFTELTKEIFVEHPKVKSFGWTQYTPYFNDGDTCYFSVHTDYIYINGESADESNWISETNITNYGTWNREKTLVVAVIIVPSIGLYLSVTSSTYMLFSCPGVSCPVSISIVDGRVIKPTRP